MLRIPTAFVMAGLLVLVMGCATEAPPKPTVRYPTRPPKEVPGFLKGTIYEYTDTEGAQPFPISGWGLVVNLRDTGDSTAPSFVRDYIIRDMIKHGFGLTSQGMGDLAPSKVLADPRVAIVKVEGFIPPGTRKDQSFDAYVSALEGNRTTSLSHGQLLLMELRLNGTQTNNPQGSINVMGLAKGDILINPAYALSTEGAGTGARASMRTGVIPNGAVAKNDWPLMLRLRQADFRLSKAIERRIDQRFQGLGDAPKVQGGYGVAFAQDEGIVKVFIPRRVGGDWEHFMGVVNHLYLDDSPEFTARMARELADEAVKPNAPLLDISFGWEALGKGALPFVAPLTTHRSMEVAFAATRAAAYLGDAGALSNLVSIAQTRDNPFRLGAVQVMGAMPDSQSLRSSLRGLLKADQALVRIEAYRILADRADPSIYSKVIGQNKFILDVIPGGGSPLVYASRQGTPRLAIFGDQTAVAMPVVFTALDETLSIASDPENKVLTLFYRGRDVNQPVKVLSRPNLAELVARLGGESAEGEASLSFSYGEIVAMVQKLAGARRLTMNAADGAVAMATFMLQEAPAIERMIGEAPTVASGDPGTIPDFNPAPPTGAESVEGRPQ